EAGLEDAGVTAIALFVARGQRVKQFGHHVGVADFRDRDTAVGQPAFFAQRDRTVGDAAQFFGFRQGGDDLFVLDQRADHVRKQGFAVAGGTVQATHGFTVVHRSFFFLPPRRRWCGPWAADRTNSSSRSLWQNEAERHVPLEE